MAVSFTVFRGDKSRRPQIWHLKMIVLVKIEAGNTITGTLLIPDFSQQTNLSIRQSHPFDFNWICFQLQIKNQLG